MRQLDQFCDRAFHLIDRAIAGLVLLGHLALLSLVGLTVVAVFFRYAFNDPIFGTNDLSRMLLLVCVACSIAYGGRGNAHVAVDIASYTAGRRFTRWSDVVVRALGVVIAALTVYALLRQGSCGMRCGHFTPDLVIPFWPFYLLLAFGIALYGLVLLAELVTGLIHFSDPADPNEKG